MDRFSVAETLRETAATHRQRAAALAGDPLAKANAEVRSIEQRIASLTETAEAYDDAAAILDVAVHKNPEGA